MKKIFLTIAILIAITSFCFSQEEKYGNEKVKLNAIGGTLGMVFSENALGRQNPSTNFSLNLYRELAADWFFSFSLGYNSYSATYDISRETTNRDIPYEWRERLSPELLEKMRSSLRWNDTIRYYVFVADIPLLFGFNRFITNSKNRLYLGFAFGTIYNGFRGEWSPTIIVPTVGTSTTIAL